MADFSCLVVEDSPMMRQLLVFALARIKRISVTEAEDGVDALQLVKRIRSDETHKDVPIIIITTEGSTEDRQRAMALGANAYITKPIQAPQVIAKVKELLKLE